MICPKCNSDLPEGLLFCPNCGFNLKDLENNEISPSVQQGEDAEQVNTEQYSVQQSGGDMPEDGSRQLGGEQQPYGGVQPINNGQPFADGQQLNNGQQFYGSQIPNGVYPYNNTQPAKKSKGKVIRNVICAAVAVIVLAAAAAGIKVHMEKTAEKRYEEGFDEAQLISTAVFELVNDEAAKEEWNWEELSDNFADNLSEKTGLSLSGDNADGYVECIMGSYYNKEKGHFEGIMLSLHYYKANIKTLYAHNTTAIPLWVTLTEDDESKSINEAHDGIYSFDTHNLSFHTLDETSITLLGFVKEPITINESSIGRSSSNKVEVNISYTYNRMDEIDHVTFWVELYNSAGDFSGWDTLKVDSGIDPYESHTLTWTGADWDGSLEGYTLKVVPSMSEIVYANGTSGTIDGEN